MHSAKPFFTDERRIPNLLNSGGAWCPVLLPWFYVSVQIWRIDHFRYEALIIPTAEGLKRLLDQKNAFLKVDAVDYVTPGDMNESGQWKMELLLEMTDLVNAFGWSIPRCKVEGGRVYRGLALEHEDEWGVERAVYSRL